MTLGNGLPTLFQQYMGIFVVQDKLHISRLWEVTKSTQSAMHVDEGRSSFAPNSVTQPVYQGAPHATESADKSIALCGNIQVQKAIKKFFRWVRDIERRTHIVI